MSASETLSVQNLQNDERRDSYRRENVRPSVTHELHTSEMACTATVGLYGADSFSPLLYRVNWM